MKKCLFAEIYLYFNIFLGIIINSNIRFSPYGLNYLEKNIQVFGSYEKNLNANTDFEIKKLSDKYFFRYDEEGKFTANNSAIFGTSGTNYYYSISDIHLMQLYEELCLVTTNNMRCSSLNRRSALQKLFAVKYFVLPTKTEYIPEYMTFVKEFDTYAGKKKLYRLNNSLPFAVPYKKMFCMQIRILRI
ncbi:MAG: YfhO family protein [Treponema succinifaciens]|nr:MAG: YfhO family protein [Treponema succinifaciens]